jgi:hypothetical protein
VCGVCLLKLTWLAAKTKRPPQARAWAGEVQRIAACMYARICITRVRAYAECIHVN